MTFYDRNAELEALERAHGSPGHGLHVVYGRRRVGNAELLKQFCADRVHV